MELTTKVLEIGELVSSFEEEMLLVLFGPKATDELKSISVIHEFEQQPETDSLQVGTKIEIGENVYTITQVGSSANENFEELGHISIYFKSGTDDLLPGAVLAEPEVFPTIEQGDVIKFYN